MNGGTLPYHYTSQGRRALTVGIVAGVWAVLLAAYLWLDAAPAVLALLVAFTLPAVYDILGNPRAQFTLTQTHLRWQAGRQNVEIPLEEIDHLRLDTRLDLSVRLSVVRPSGVRLRVPYPATPPHGVLEPLAQKAGLRTQRHHFSLMG